MKEIKEVILCVVGCGGTGSSFVELLTRYLSQNHNQSRLRIREMLLIDGDIVEEKNLKNQAFIMDDVGYPKSAVLADAMNQYLAAGNASVRWKSYNKYIVSSKELQSLIEEHCKSVTKETLVCIFGCCDNHNCRLMMEDIFNSTKFPNIFLYDSANEFKNGEVVFAHKINMQVHSPCRSVIFPDIKTGDLRNVTEMSCEELNNVAPQHLLVNRFAAQVLMQGFTSMFEEGVPKFGFCVFNAASMNSQFYERRVDYGSKEKSGQTRKRGSNKGKKKEG